MSDHGATTSQKRESLGILFLLYLFYEYYVLRCCSVSQNLLKYKNIQNTNQGRQWYKQQLPRTRIYEQKHLYHC